MKKGEKKKKWKRGHDIEIIIENLYVDESTNFMYGYFILFFKPKHSQVLWSSRFTRFFMRIGIMSYVRIVVEHDPRFFLK